MKDAIIEGRMVQAGPEAPKEARCPACGGRVVLRRRRNGRDNYTWFYRHARGEGPACPRKTSWNS